MKYEPLYKTYYKNKEEYQALYESRFSSEDAIRTGIAIADNEAFCLQCSELSSLSADILRVDKEVTLLKASLPEQAVSWFRMESLIDEIIITNNIEGVHSTRREIKDVIASLGESKRHEKRLQGLVNQYILLGEKNGEKNIKKNINLRTCTDIRALYDKLVLTEVLENDADNAPDGKIFRKNTVEVRNAIQKVIHTGVYPEEQIIAYMQKSLDFLHDDDLDILIRTAVFHYLFGYIHPFYDGNGRLSRFISSFFLSTNLDPLVGCRLSYTIQDNLSDYYKMFKLCNDPIDKGDITPFAIMFLGVVLKAEKNLLYELATRRDLYETELQQIKALSGRDKWDKTTESLLNTKLNKLRTYDLIEETKDKKVSYYKLKYENLSRALSAEA